MTIDKGSSVPLYKQLAEEIIKQINAGKLLPDTKLPPIRVLANETQVNSATVAGAYKYLESRNFVYSIMGSGVYVAQKHRSLPFVPTQGVDMDGYINFAAKNTMSEYFPTDDFRRAFDAVLARDGAKVFDYAGWHGFGPLRSTVSQILKTHDIQALPENIQITSGINQGLGILLDELISHGDYIITETPSSAQRIAAFASRGAKILKVPMLENGLDMDKFTFLVKKYSPKIFYLMPTFHTPTGLCYNNEIKAQVLKLAYNCNAYIIEDNGYGDFYYSQRPTTLRAMDAERVIYLSSFDKILTSGLAGYIACPPHIIKRLHGADGAAGYIQRGLDEYFTHGDFNAHCAKIRSIYARKYKRTMLALDTFLSDYTSYVRPEGGLGCWVRSPRADLTNELIKHGVLVSPSTLYSTSAETHFRISFANTQEDDISKGIGIIASVMRSRAGEGNSE